MWAKLLPRIYKYDIKEEIMVGEKGELSKRFVFVYHDHRGDEYRARMKKRLASESTPSNITREENDEKGVNDKEDDRNARISVV
jgi:hypothetical protein